MKFQIESEGGRLHWVVRCIEKGKVVEVHRFYRTADRFIYHRGNHGEFELPAQNALIEHLAANPHLTADIMDIEPGEFSTMDVRRKAAGGGKREAKKE